MTGPGEGASGDPVAGAGLFRCERVGDRTVVHTARAHSPLRLLLPRGSGHAQWAFVATFGGGLVDGDVIDLTVDLGAHATLLLGTQAGTKAYRADRGTTQRTTAHVGPGALLAALPDPVSCFAGSRHTQRNDITLEGDASLVLVDTMTSGRKARGERWDFCSFASETRVTRDGVRLVTDAVSLDPAHGDLHERMARFDVLSTVFAFGPRVLAVRAALRHAHELPTPHAAMVASASPLGEDGVVLRLAASGVETMTHALQRWLAPLESELGDDPFARKW